MNQSDVFQVLRNERNYQLRRWGVRQPDDTMREATHSVSEFLIFMRDHYNEATRSLTHSCIYVDTLTSLRKLVALGIACLEQHDSYDNSAVSMEDIFKTVQWSGDFVPACQSDLGTFLLRIKFCLDQGEKDAAYGEWRSGLARLQEIICVGIQCFRVWGVTDRGPTILVTNARDCQFA